MQMTLAEWVLRSLNSPPTPPLCPDLSSPLVYHHNHSTRSSHDAARSNSNSNSRPRTVQFERSEWLYMQADLSGKLLEDIDFSVEPFSLILCAMATSTAQTTHASSTYGGHALQSKRLQVTQQPRLWLSPQGAVSPLHFDRSVSLLTQVMGSKRMLFFAPSDLDKLEPFPRDHMLARRCRYTVCESPCFETESHLISDSRSNNINRTIAGEETSGWRQSASNEGVAVTWETRDVLGDGDSNIADCWGDGSVGEDNVRRDCEMSAHEVVLGPGDVVMFGPHWAHWTASETVSASVTVRVGA